MIEYMKRIVGAIFLMLLFGTNWVSAQCGGFESPEPTCIQVMDDGSVDIYYDQFAPNVIPAPDADSLHLYYSPTGLPTSFTKITAASINVGPSWGAPPIITAPIPPNQQTTLDAYYHIVAECNLSSPNNLLPPSSNIQAIKLSHTISNDFIVDMSWNWNQVTSNANFARIYRAFPSSASWNLIEDEPFVQGPMSFRDTVYTCDDSVKYQIRITDLTHNCEDRSSWAGPFQIKDNTSPIQVTIDTVTFDPNSNRPLINWSPSSPDTKGYVVLFMDEECQTYTVVDTVYGRFNTSMIDMSVWPGNGPAKYAIIPFDECNLTAPVSECETSMFLTPTLDICEKSVQLDWNHYGGFASGTDILYKIYVSIGSSNFVYVGSTTENTFKHGDPIQNTILDYKIVAFENGGAGPSTTSSQEVQVDAEFLKQPEYNYLRFATVSAPNQIRLQLYTDTKSDAHTYNLKRALDSSDIFVTVNVFDAPELKIDTLIDLTDNDPQTDLFQYYYKVELRDSCGGTMGESNVASNIALQVFPNHTTRVNRLIWSNVYGWQGTTFAYKIYRYLDGVLVGDPLTKFPDTGAVTVFHDSLLRLNDNITAGKPSKGNYCYYVEAIENEPTFPRLLPAKSISNEVCVVQQPYITKANAFTPNGDGLNERFKPTLIYHDIVNYEFYVMNRYGEVIYLTQNVDAAWDGTYQGDQTPAGVYIYSVKYRSSTGQSFEEVSTVTLLR